MKLLLLVLLVSSCAWAANSASICSSSQYDMLDWMTQDNYSSYQMTGTANPIVTFQDTTQGYFYWTKSTAGFPWDVNVYDNTNTGYIYQWVTENGWSDPSMYK